MSENAQMEMDQTQVHYVYGGPEYVLDKDASNSELSNLMISESPRALLVDGQYIVTDSQTILLQEGDNNLMQYYINENNEGFVVGDEDTSVNNLFESTEVLQLVEEETNGEQQIIYFTNENTNNEEFTSQVIQEEEEEEEGVEQYQDEDGNVYPFKRIKLEEGQFLSLEDLVEKEQESMVTEEEENVEEQTSVQYAVMEDGSFQIINTQPITSSPVKENNNQSRLNLKSKECSNTHLVDLSKITGRNLITGQTVTLHSYMEKLKKKLKNNSSVCAKTRPSKKIYTDDVKRPELTDLLDKKISIGKTRSGKKIVGKIIRVEKKTTANNVDENNIVDNCEEGEEREVSDNLIINDPVDESSDSISPNTSSARDNIEASSNENLKKDETKILVRKCSVSKESFEQISKTLGGVMEMQSVRKKLENKNIVVKLVEKKYVSETDSFIKNTSYSYGYMDKEMFETNDEAVIKWKFVPDQNTQDVLLSEHSNYEGSEEEQGNKTEKQTKFPITTSLTIVITYGKGGNKTIRVNLDPAPGNLCTICAQYFKTNLQLRQHMHNVHNTYGNMNCEICDKSFADVQKFQEHRNVHVQEGKLFICSECNKCFSTQSKLNKHLPSHDMYLRPLECSVCEARCASEWALKKHLLTHTGIKLFRCDICHKQFLTQYDLNFHKKIHFPDKYFVCTICLRTFSRHSNLLRHTEIHKGSGALYKCDICYCSYNFISSLTRHKVQNHIDAGDFRKKIQKV